MLDAWCLEVNTTLFVKMSKATYPGTWCAVPQPRIFIGDMCNNFLFLSPLSYMHTYLCENVPVVTLILAVGLETVEFQFGFDLLNSLWPATQFSAHGLASGGRGFL